jgi:alkanesulfonate monooxygenase SsuD/methylene tetrahydromethanopterin reductase-like flavin-dependent oxidoreductase (luciferase family)
MKFGIFEHMDDSGVPQGRHFSNRLSLIEEYDRHGFHAYHLADHHGTPLGLPSSSANGIFWAWIFSSGLTLLLRCSALSRLLRPDYPLAGKALSMAPKVLSIAPA